MGKRSKIIKAVKRDPDKFVVTRLFSDAEEARSAWYDKHSRKVVAGYHGLAGINPDSHRRLVASALKQAGRTPKTRMQIYVRMRDNDSSHGKILPR